MNSPKPTPPTLIVDSREREPLPLAYPFIVAGLQSGDYSIAGCENLFAVERKSIPDLVGCCCGENRARFERELHRLRGFRFARLLIVGSRAEIETGRYRSGIAPASVLGTIAAFEVRYVPVVWCADPERAARQVESWAHYFSRELLKVADSLRQGQEAGQARGLEIAV